MSRLIASGDLKPITSRIGFDDVPAGPDKLAKGEVVRHLVVVRIGD